MKNLLNHHVFSGLRNFTVYAVLSVVQKAGSFLLLPVYTHYLGPSDMGIISISLAISTLLPAFISLNSYEFIYFTALKKDEGWKREVASFFVFQLLAVFLFSFLFLMAFTFFLTDDFVLFDVPFFPYLSYTFFFSLFSVLFNSFNLVLQALSEVKNFTLLNLTFFAVSTTLILILLVPFHFGAMSFIYANFITYLLYGGIIVFIVRRRFGLHFNAKDLRKGLKYSVPLIPHILSHWGKGYMDRVFLASFISVSAAGLFHFSITISSVIAIGVDAFVKVNNPLFFQNFENVSKRPLLVSTLHVAAAGFSILGLMLSLFSKELMFFFDARYENAYTIIPLLVTGNLLYLIYLGIVNVIFIKKMTLLVSSITFTSGVLSTVASYLLVKQFGLLGAALSYMTSNFLISLLVFGCAKWVDPVRWRISKILMLLILPVAGYAVNSFLPATLGIRIAMTLVLATLILLSTLNDIKQIGGFLNTEEKKLYGV